MVKMNNSLPVSQAQSYEDAALAYTCHIMASVLSSGGLPPNFADRGAPFVPTVSTDEVIIADGPYQRMFFDAAGDGSYAQYTGTGSSFFAGSSVKNAVAGTVALGAAQLAFASVVNRHNRKKAALNAIPRWMFMDSGTIYVSSCGFYPISDGGVVVWPWSAITQMNLLGPHHMEMFGNIDGGGEAHWRIQSPWIELLFALWAWSVNPRHPALRGGGWLPPGWLAFAVHTGAVPAPQATAITAYPQTLR